MIKPTKRKVTKRKVTKKAKKASKITKSRKVKRKNPKDLLVDQDFHSLIQAMSGINNLFYLDYLNNSNKYDITNEIPDLENDLKILALKVTKVRNESKETKLYGTLPKIGEYEIGSLGNLRQSNSVHNMDKISNYIKRIVLILTEFKKKQFTVSDKNYRLLEKEIFDLYDEVRSYFIDANVSWI